MNEDEIFVDDTFVDFDGGGVCGGFMLPDDEELDKMLEGPKKKRGHAYKAEYDNDTTMVKLRMDGKSYREIAKAMGIPTPSTVRNRLVKMGISNKGANGKKA